MSEKKDNDKKEKKGFFARLLDKLDEKMKEKAGKPSCCSGSKDKGSSCCG